MRGAVHSAVIQQSHPSERTGTRRRKAATTRIEPAIVRDVRERLRQHQQTMSEYKNVAFFVAYTICFLLVIAQQVGILGDCLTSPAPYASRHAAPCMLALFDVWRMHSVGLGTLHRPLCTT